MVISFLPSKHIDAAVIHAGLPTEADGRQANDRRPSAIILMLIVSRRASPNPFDNQTDVTGAELAVGGHHVTNFLTIL